MRRALMILVSVLALSGANSELCHASDAHYIAEYTVMRSRCYPITGSDPNSPDMLACKSMWAARDYLIHAGYCLQDTPMARPQWVPDATGPFGHWVTPVTDYWRFGPANALGGC